MKALKQAPLDGFNTMPPLCTVVISRRQDFENLFEGFTKLSAISYVVSPDLLLEFFDKRGYAEVEVLVGENLAESYRQGLEQKGIEVTERLAERVEAPVPTTAMDLEASIKASIEEILARKGVEPETGKVKV